MPWIDSLDWSSLNALRKYPIREGLSASSDDNLFSIPDTLIVDFSLCASSDVTKRFYISNIFNKLTAVVITISDDEDVVVGTFETTTQENDTTYYLNPTADYTRANGKLTVGSFKDLQYQPSGSFSFSITATEFEPRTIIPGLKGIDRISFTDAINGEQSLTGSVLLASRNNLIFSYADNRVYMDAGGDIGLNKPCVTGNCVKSINGVKPDPETGDIGLVGIDCLSIFSEQEHTLNIEDLCCVPCAGCNDLEELTSRTIELENKLLDLRDLYNQANSQLQTYLNTINSNCECP
jgi:hypothetical protein